MLKKALFWLFLLACGLFSYSNAYLFGMKSFDNTVENILAIEKEYWIFLPIIAFIYDPRERQDVVAELEKIGKELGTERIYHISLSPNNFTAKQVAEWAFDQQYLSFFQTIKKLRLKVIFRTMHEMNGGRYPRSSNPQAFQQARKRVWILSRNAGLDQHNILFDMSVNAWDLPTKDKIPNQSSSLIECNTKNKKSLNCPTFEDYYPGDEYVDIIGFTFYNRGKGNSNRRWWNPDKIVNNPSRKTLERIKKFNKPIFIDEVGTTAVNYEGPYNYEKSIEVYKNNAELKNDRIRELIAFLQKEKQILGASYFNIDLTNGLQQRIIWELDRALINLSNGKFYESFRDIYSKSSHDLASILQIFGLESLQINGKKREVPPHLKTKIKAIESIIANKYQTTAEKADLYKHLTQTKTTDPLFNQAVEILKESYQKETIQ